MYEAPPPERRIAYPPVVVGLTAACVVLFSVAVFSAIKANKSEEALAAAKVAAESRERALDEKLAASSSGLARVKAADQERDRRLIEAGNRIKELTAEIEKMRVVTTPEVGRAYATKSAMSSDADTSRKAQLLAEALAAYDRGNLQAAREGFEAILSIDRYDVGAREGLAMVLGRQPSGAWRSLNHAYLAKIDADSSMQRSASGVRYKVVDPGYVEKPNAFSKVMIRYDAKLVDGSVFDSTHDSEPLASPLASLVPALAEGVQLIGLRGRITIVSPSDRAFASQAQMAQMGVPADSVVVFEVELVEVDAHR